MIALITSAGLVFFLLVPGILFKGLFSLFIPLDKFHRTRTEELTFGAFASLLPLALTFLAVFSAGWIGNHPFFFPTLPLRERATIKPLFLRFTARPFSTSTNRSFGVRPPG
jgi:hypothetical protein